MPRRPHGASFLTDCGNFVQAATSIWNAPWAWPARKTLKRRANVYLNRWEHIHVKTRLRSLPFVLNIEPSNACNLQCPFCYTGAGGIGRPRASMPLPLYRRLLDELADSALLLKAYGWGEPLLCGHLAEMIALAHARGLYTIVTTNFSLRYSAARMEALVASGLSEFVVSIDGARQDTYEQYRVGGWLELVLDNLRCLQHIKARMASASPRLAIEFHPFPWNVGDVPAIRELARALDVQLRLYKGCMPDDEWAKNQDWAYCGDPKPIPCHFLWTTAVIAADGGVAPCNGTFYAADDMGCVDLSALAHTPFRAVWNNERFQLARGLFRRARASIDGARGQACYECPNTKLWLRWAEHVLDGGTKRTFDLGMTTNDTWTYFWNRRPPAAARLHATDRAPARRSVNAA